jgi:hypothetical protein
VASAPRPSTAAWRAGLALTGALLACGEGTYLFLGRRYAPDRDCLQTTTAVDVLSGSDPGDCATRCVSAPLGDGGADRDTYLTTMCPPLPHGIEPSDDAVCARATAALARKDTCLADGGSTAPAPTRRDAATD